MLTHTLERLREQIRPRPSTRRLGGHLFGRGQSRQVALWAAAAAVLASGAALAGCSTGEGSGQQSSAPTQTLTVYAAASLTDSFTEIGEHFEAQHDGVDVEFNFAGSSDLVSQITEGAPADVFASADQANMTKAVNAGVNSAAPVTFARNTLAIVTPAGNPAGVTQLSDLARTDLKLVICAPQVPCGAASQQAASNAGITLTPVSEESKVTDVLGKVTSGQADAGLVYATDAKGAGDEVDTIEIPSEVNVTNDYPITVLTEAVQTQLAAQFVEFVRGDDGQQVLADHGFLPAV